MTRWFQNLRLRSKFTLILLASLLIVLGGALLASRMPYAAYDRELYTKTVQTLTMFAQEIQSELDSAAYISFTMIGDNVLQTSLTELNIQAVGSEEWVEAKRELDKRVSNFSFLSHDIQSVRIRSRDGTYFMSAWRGAPLQLSKFIQLRDAVSAARGREVWNPDPDNPGTLILARDIREIAGFTLKSIGMLVMRVDLAGIVSRLNARLTRMGMPVTVAIYMGDTLVYSDGGALSGAALESDGYLVQRTGGEDTLFVRHTMPGAGWTYLTAVPYGGVSAAIRDSSGAALAVSAAALAIALALSSLLVSSILNHLTILLGKFSAFAKDPLAAPGGSPPYETRRDEIGGLHRGFDRMAAGYAETIRENYVKQQLLLEARVRQLRAQIQPHFLNNTLESIYCLAMIDGNERVAAMTHALGSMFRAALKDQRDIITIGEDMRIAEEYLNIQRVRYGDRLRASFNVGKEFLNARIAAMTIQPLVENSVRHALEEMLEPCEIRVYCRREDGFIELVVADNGGGMPQEVIGMLERGEYPAGGTGLGLANIHQRLRLAFSGECGLRVRREDGWTIVAARLNGEEEPACEAAGG
ncbi:MAG: sensor histidine kinase [Oscillospiraceae bacterium]|nr:sensor histidine kinase [Oscillospiraceae bacterium]